MYQGKDNYFQLMISGKIELAEFISVANAYCKYCFVYGSDWKQVGGQEESITPVGYKDGKHIIFGTPIEATFSSTNPFRWPQIVLSFYGQDLFGNDVSHGYATTYLPTVPGCSNRKCPIFVPQAMTTIQRVLGLFTGRRAEFIEPRIVATVEGRDVTRVTTRGFVDLSFTTMFRNTKKCGYDLYPQTMGKITEFPTNLHNSSTKKHSNPSKKRERNAPNKHFLGSLQENEEVNPEDSAQTQEEIEEPI